MKVLVIANQYAGNKGDCAIAYFVTRELHRNGVTSTVMSTNDRRLWRDTTWLTEYGVELAPWGWNVEQGGDSSTFMARLRHAKSRGWRRLYPLLRGLVNRDAGGFWLPVLSDYAFLRALKDTDLVISTGGHHVTTLLSEDAVSEQLYDMGLVLLAKKPLVLWSQSIGPLDFNDPINGRYVRNVLQRTSHIFLRDRQSDEVLRRIDLNGATVHRTLESVLGLNDLCQAYVPPSRRRPTIGIAIYATQHRPAEERIRYVRMMASLVDHAFARGLRVRFFPMEIRGTGPDDRPLIHEILRESMHRTEVTVEPDMETPQHLSEVSKCRYFVGHKTHAVIFALTVGTPLLAIAYHPKTQDFMQQYGLGAFCVGDRSLQSDDLLRCFDSLIQRADEIGASVFAKGCDFGRRVRADFHELIESHAGMQITYCGRRAGGRERMNCATV